MSRSAPKLNNTVSPGLTELARDESFITSTLGRAPELPLSLIAIVEQAEARLMALIENKYKRDNPGWEMPPDHAPRQIGKRAGWCKDAAVEATQVAFAHGLRSANVDKPHSTLLSRVEQLLTGQDRSETFSHQFSAIMVDDRPFLVDLTVGQFVYGHGEFGARCVGWSGSARDFAEIQWSAKYIENLPVFQALIKDGAVELTPHNLLEYISTLSINQSSEYRAILERGISEESIGRIFRCWPEP